MNATSLLLALLAVGAPAESPPPRIVVLGVAQDGGLPHIGCKKSCCRDAYRGEAPGARVASLGLVDEASGRYWLFDATPDLPRQLHRLAEELPGGELAGVFLTHAHIGHYLGLAYLGREALGAKAVPVYAMPRMQTFLEENGPWDQLVRLGNIVIHPLRDGERVVVGEGVGVVPFLVPHRDEYSETVGFRIEGPHRAAAFVPDIDKWERWDRPVEDLVRSVDLAFLDATFFDASELPGRDLSEIPHPLVVESLERLAPLSPEERARVRFLHLNHSNPLHRRDSEARRRVEEAGMAVAEEGERHPL